MTRRWACMAFLILWVIGSACLAALPAEESGRLLRCDYRLVAVPLFAQQTELWCWAASAEMIMAYYGEEVPQCVQANRRFERSDCCTLPAKGHPCVKVAWPEMKKYGFCLSTRYGALNWRELLSQFDARRPVGFSWQWGGGVPGRASGHFMVARGYVDLEFENLGPVKLVVVNDPSLPNEDKRKGGSFIVVAYDYYVASPLHHRHWYDFYDITREEEGRLP